MRAGRARLHPRRIHRRRALRELRRARRPPYRADHRVGNRQHLAARAELLERGVVRQLALHSQRFPQVRADGQQLQHPAIGGLQIRPQDQARHQLPLREIMPAARGTIVGQMPPAQLHRQFRHPLHRRFLGRFLAHPLTDAPEIKRFLQSKM